MGKKCHETGIAEIKIRATGEVIEVALEDLVDKVLALREQMFAELTPAL